MSDRNSDVVVATLEGTANLLGDLGLSRINERDHLQKAFVAALGTAAAEVEGAPQVKQGLPSEVPLDFARGGAYDAALVWSDTSPTLFELKAGDALWACIWDVAKLAAALRAGVGSRAYLVAAAPSSQWPEPGLLPAVARQRGKGFELFATAEHDAADLRDGYVSSWRQWDKDGTGPGNPTGYRPTRITPRIATTFVGRATFRTTAAGEAGDWELRASEVCPVVEGPDDWISWVAP